MVETIDSGFRDYSLREITLFDKIIGDYKEKLGSMSVKELKIEALTCERAWKRRLIRDRLSDEDDNLLLSTDN